MKLDFSVIPETVVPHFKGGEGEAHVRKYVDDRMGNVVQLTLPVGSSIGLHTHKGNCEVIYVMSGEGVCTDDGVEYPICAGTRNYCPEGHTHGIRNTGSEPLVLFGVLPNVK